MHICLVGDGQSIHIRRWAGWLHDHGHYTTILSLTRVVDSKGYDQVLEVKPIMGRFGYARTAIKIRGILKRLGPDVVHGHYLTSGGFASSLAPGVPRIVSAWGSDVYADTKDFLKRQCIKWAVKHSDVTLGDSDHIVNAVKSLVPRVDARKVIFGIDTELFKPNPIKHDRFRFLSVRATGGVYNSDVIIKAFERANLDAELWMQEPNSDGFSIKDYVESRSELKKKVVWYGRRPYEKMPELYNSCDVGISVPNWDSSSTAVLEAFSSQMPVILSAIPQNDEWINGATLWQRELIDVNRLAEKMAFIRRMNWLVEETGVIVREQVITQGNFETEMQKAEAIYKEVVDANR